MLNRIKLFFILPLVVASFSLLLIGCSDSVTNPSDNVTVSYTGTRDSAAGDQGALELDTVKVLIKDVKLNVKNSGDSTNFKTGPFVLYINFNSSVTLLSSAQVPNGEYDKLKFEIHKLADNETPPDPDFLDVNGRYSVVVKGRYNGTSFVFKSDKSAHQKVTFPKEAPVTTDAVTNVTIKMEPYKWFMSAGVYLDPALSENMTLIENNIKDNINQNIKAFKDNNRDGQPD